MSSDDPDKQTEKGSNKLRHRSPNYPVIDLKEAVTKTDRLFQQVKRHSVGVEVAVKALGYSEKSSSGAKCIAALRAFGLLDDVKDGGGTLVKLSGRGLDLVADYSEDDREWKDAVQAAALAPPIHKEIWERYSGSLPPDGEMRRYLVRGRDHKFNENSVDDFIAKFRETLSYSGLSESAKSKNLEAEKKRPDVGDFVQWTLSGVDQFEIPKRVEKFADTNCEWAFLEGEGTAAAVSDLTVMPAPEQEKPLRTPPTRGLPSSLPPSPSKSGGPYISFPLSAGNTFELRLTARVSKKDFQRLQKLIELSEDSLVENVEN